MRDESERSPLDLVRVAEAWRRATDREVLELLDGPADTPPEVVAIVLREADRRGLPGDAVEATEWPARAVLVRAARAIHHCLQAHPLLVAAGVGFAIPLGFAVLARASGGNPAPLVRVAFLVAFLGGLAYACWPLRSYRDVAFRTFAGSVSYMLVGFWNVRVMFPQASAWIIAQGMALFWAAFWGVPCLVLCGVVFLRNRYWPLRQPGRCAGCGYDLRGLPELRCPECGTPFEAAVPLA